MEALTLAIRIVVILVGIAVVMLLGDYAGHKVGRMRYEDEMLECIKMGIKFTCCDLAAKIIGLDESELMEGIEMQPSFKVADLLLKYAEEGQLIISL